MRETEINRSDTEEAQHNGRGQGHKAKTLPLCRKHGIALKPGSCA